MTNASDIISEVGTLLGDENQDLFTQSRLLTFLNRAIKDIANRSKTIHHEMFTAKEKGVYQYPLPPEFLRADLVMYSDGQFYPLSRANLRGVMADRYFNQTGDPLAYDVWGNSRYERVIGTAAGGDETTLQDPSKDFTADDEKVFVDDLVLNISDDSEAVVTSVGAEVKFSEGLAGGSDNTFQAGDSYKIVSPHAPLQTLILHPAPTSTDTAGAESIAVSYAAKHRPITQGDIDKGNDGLELDEEFETALIHRVKFWARDFERDTAEKNTEFQYYQSEYRQALPSVRKRVREYQSAWRKLLLQTDIRISGPTRTYPSWFGY